jgi:hypothetical protein
VPSSPNDQRSHAGPVTSECKPDASGWGFSLVDSESGIKHDRIHGEQQDWNQKHQSDDFAPQGVRRGTEEQERTKQTRANEDDHTWQLEVRRLTRRCHKGCPDPKPNQPHGSYANRVDPRPWCSRHWQKFQTRVHSQPQRKSKVSAVPAMGVLDLCDWVGGMADTLLLN